MNILITQNHLVDYAGSEIISLELARYFSSRGWSVDVLTNLFDKPISAEFSHLKNVRVSTNEKDLEKTKYSLVWIHHQIIPDFIEKQLDQSGDRPRIIFNHMSPYEPFEYPRNARLENDIADVVLANSVETKDMLIEAGVKTDLIEVFGNPAPDSFSKNSKAIKPFPENILVVSNHFPETGMKALKILKDRGLKVDGVGVSFDRQELITPEIINKYDVVVTIGKTVQFCILSNTPVYIYDHFGGPGYLTIKNYKNAMLHNFSGRGFDNKKTAQDIAEEIYNSFAVAQKEIKDISTKSSKDFLLSSKIDKLFSKLFDGNLKSVVFSHEDWSAMVINNRLIKRTFLASIYNPKQGDEIARLNSSIELQQKIVEDMGLKLDSTALELQQCQHRLARFPVNIIDRFVTYLSRKRMVRGLIRAVRLLKKDSPDRATIKGFLYLRYRSIPLFYKFHAVRRVNSLEVIGMIRERNESLLLKDTLDHLSTFVDGIVVFDDASTDDSVDIALRHPAVIEVIVNKHWGKNRTWEETSNRAVLMERAKRYNPQWFFYSDADERFEGDIKNFLLNKCPSDIHGIRVSLFDAYMTKGDSEPYIKDEPLIGFRKYFGIEKRDILMAWRNNNKASYLKPDSREPSGIEEKNIITKFYCQHYGKSLSTEQWEETCNYYIDNFPQYSEKWRSRIGKSIHTKSDFQTKLYTWEEVKKRGVNI